MHASRLPGPFGARPSAAATSASATSSSEQAALDPERRALLDDVGELFTAANGFAQIALLDMEAQHPAREALEMLGRVLWRAQNVSHGLASPEAAGAWKLRATDLRRVVREATEIAKGFAAPGVVVRLQVPTEPVTVRGDDGALLRVVLQLVRIAVESIDAGGGRLVDVRVEAAEGGNATVVVRDDGPGMSADAVRNARRLLYDRPEEDRREGLGLWLAERVAEHHGGTLDIASAPGAGTEVRLTLPRAAGA